MNGVDSRATRQGVGHLRDPILPAVEHDHFDVERDSGKQRGIVRHGRIDKDDLSRRFLRQKRRQGVDHLMAPV